MMQHTHSIRRAFRLVVVASVVVSSALAGCQSAASNQIMTQAEQQAMTPTQAIMRLAEGNARFANGQSVRRDLTAQARETATGQYPFAVVLACIDSRCAPEIVFDQGVGKIFAPRMAGNYAQADVLGGMEFATKISGAKAIVVVGHTRCGAVMGACDNVQLGNLTTVIDAIRPAVNAVPGFEGARTSQNTAFVDAVTEENVRLTIAKIRRDSPILRELEETGKIKIAGAMHDLSTGRVTFIN